MRHLSDRSLKEIEEFVSSGFAKSTPVLLRYMRRDCGYHSSHIKIFRPRVSSKPGGRCSILYSIEDIFGNEFMSHGRISYLYDMRRKKEFVDFLVGKFIGHNPSPDMKMRHVFTHMLHSNRLHWEGCCCQGKD